MLVVDDLNTMTRIVDGMLRKFGSANVDQVHGGPTALQKLREKSYLFVVSDREMPGMNGLELAREIRADPKVRNAPLVIMSASSEPQHAEAAIAAGAKFFMTKPFNLTTLKDVIRQSPQSGGSGADQIRCRSHHQPGGDCRALSERHRQHVRSRRCRASNNRADRDGFVDSLLGVSDTQRELAVDFDVDPYTDFPPLAQKLKEMTGVMASGSLPIKAGLSFVPGGIGIAVSSVATVSDARDTLRSKTAAQVIAETRATLLGLGIPDENISRLVENRNYTPADLLIMALALKKLNAENTTAFVDHVAGAGTRNVAFYHRRRAQILAARSNELGGIVSFVTFGGQPINITRNGNVVAAFTVDDIAWTDVQQRTFIAATAEIQRMKPGATPVLATTGAVTPMAAAEIGQRGWKIVHIKP